MRISDWSSDVCSSDLAAAAPAVPCEGGDLGQGETAHQAYRAAAGTATVGWSCLPRVAAAAAARGPKPSSSRPSITTTRPSLPAGVSRSAEHTSELQSLMRISYAVFCLKNKQHVLTTLHC